MNDHLVREAVAGEAVQIVNIHSRSVRELCSGDYTAEQIDDSLARRLTYGRTVLRNSWLCKHIETTHAFHGVSLECVRMELSLIG